MECVVHDAICSRSVPTVIRDAGARPVMERVGYTFIGRRVLEENAVFGGEVSGHFFYRELAAKDDGMYSFLCCARMVMEAGRSLSTGEAEIASRGFFDVRDRPPIGLWVESISRRIARG